MKNRRNYYRVLQVQPDAPVEVIRAAYKTLMRELRLHPDLGGELWNAQILNEAYEVLSDDEKRRDYDILLYERYTKKPVRDALSDKAPLITLFCPFCKRPLARRAKPEECCPTCRSPLRSEEEENTAHSPRRTRHRIKKNSTVYYHTTWPQKRRSARLIDVSTSGLRFHCSEKLTPDMLVKLSGPFLRGVAKVINVHKCFLGEQKVYSVGAEFISVVFVQPKGGFYSSKA